MKRSSVTLTEQELIQRAGTIAAEYPFIAAVYLFGSIAEGRQRSGSDVDLAVVSSKILSGWEKVELETSFSNGLRHDVDVVVFGQAGPLLQHQILRKGRLIYEKDSQVRVRQEVDARYAYLDTRHLYKEYRGR